MTIRPPGGGAIALAGEDRIAAVEELRTYLRSASVDDDETLAAALDTALAVGEAFLGTAIVARDVHDVLAVDPCWRALPVVPVNAVGAVVGLPAEGAAFALPAESYAIDIDADGIGWVRVTRLGAAGRIAVTYTVGMAPGWARIAQPIRQGVVMLAAHLSEGRDTDPTPPASVTALWRPYRRMRLNAAVRA